jgi:hypothetical protein
MKERDIRKSHIMIKNHKIYTAKLLIILDFRYTSLYFTQLHLSSTHLLKHCIIHHVLTNSNGSKCLMLYNDKVYVFNYF